MGESTNADSTIRPMTMAEWGALPEDVSGELVDGHLVEEEVPTVIHEMIVMWLGEILRRWFVPRGGVVGGSNARFAVTRTRGRKPDVFAFLPGRRPPLDRRSSTSRPI